MEIQFYSTDTMDPAKAPDEFSCLATSHIFDPLVTVDEKWTVYPVLAHAHESNADSTVWTFHLRDGVEFHDGKSLNSADVVYSIGRQFTVQGAAFPLVAPFLDPSGIKALDSRTVQISLKQPNAFFDVFLASAAFSIVQDGTTDFTNPVGTGPFIFKTYSQGNYLELTRNPKYWQEGLPYLDGLRIVHNADSSAMLQSVITGQSQIANSIDLSLLPVLKSANGVQTLVKKNGVYMPLSLDQTQAPFTDVRVRQAFKMAVDRQRYVQEAFHGYGSVTPDIPVPPDDPWFPDSVQPYPYDPAQAMSLLKAAGYPLNTPITIYTIAGDPSSTAAVVHAGLLNEAGIKTNIVQQDLDTWAVEVVPQEARRREHRLSQPLGRAHTGVLREGRILRGV